MLVRLVFFAALGLALPSLASLRRAVDVLPQLNGPAVHTTVSAQLCNAGGNCTAAINAVLEACSAAQASACTVQLEAATYNMEVRAFSHPTLIQNLTNVAIMGAGALNTTLLYDDVAHFITIYECENVKFTGFSIDMVRVPFTVGSVTNFTQGDATAGMRFTVALSSDELSMYPIDNATVQRFRFMRLMRAVIGYDAEFERFVTPDHYMLADPCAVTFESPSVHVTCPAGMKGHIADYTVGKKLVLRHTVYDAGAFYFRRTRGIVIADVIMYTATGMGISVDKCTDITLDGFQILRRVVETASGPVARAMSTTADGFHVCNSLGGQITVTGCVFEGQGDDGINVNTRMARIVNSTTSGNATTLALWTFGSDPTSYFDVGVPIKFFDGRTLLAQPGLAGHSVVSIDAGAKSITVSPALTSAEAKEAQFALIVNGAAIAEGVLIANTAFRNNRARGVLLKQPNAVIRDCSFSGMTSPAIMSEIDGCYWMEGLPIHNWTVTRITVTNVGIWAPTNWVYVRATVPHFQHGEPTRKCVTADSVGVFQNVEVSHSAFVLNGTTNLGQLSQPASAAFVAATVGVNVTDNTVRVIAAPGKTFEFTITGSTDVNYSRNECQFDSPDWTACPIRH